MYPKNQGIFIISLDFELLWGIFDKAGASYKEAYFEQTRRVIPEMLERFAKKEISATWATVGMLFAENEEEWRYYSPESLPTYRNKKLSAYEWTKQNGIRPAVHFAPELISQIIQAPYQELGSHSFAHYYTLVRGQSPEQFRQDLRASQRIANEKFGFSLKSLVFPRNHINELYLPICLEEGYEFVRGNPQNWFWQETQHESFCKKFLRSADCFFPLGKRSSYPITEIMAYPQEPVVIPASRILRPYSNSNIALNKARLRRILNEMEYAAISGEVYHLWWHPHNFGNKPKACLRELDEIINKYIQLHDKYGFQSINMAGLGEKIQVWV